MTQGNHNGWCTMTQTCFKSPDLVKGQFLAQIEEVHAASMIVWKLVHF